MGRTGTMISLMTFLPESHFGISSDAAHRVIRVSYRARCVVPISTLCIISFSMTGIRVILYHRHRPLSSSTLHQKVGSPRHLHLETWVCEQTLHFCFKRSCKTNCKFCRACLHCMVCANARMVAFAIITKMQTSEPLLMGVQINIFAGD